MNASENKTAVFVTVTEGVRVQMDAAFLAGAFSRSGYAVRAEPTDFCTEADAFSAHLAAAGADVIVVPYVPEFREILRHLSGLAAKSAGVPAVVVGEALHRETHPTPFEDGVTAVPGDPGLGVAELLAGADAPGDARTERVAPWLAVFGEDVTRCPMAGSLFAEVGVLPLLATRESVDALSPTASLARLQAPVTRGPVTLDVDAALAPLDGAMDPLRRISWWDRDANDGVLVAAAAARERGVPHQEARLHLASRSPASLADVAATGIDRVVFEIDRAPGHAPRPGGGATPEEAAPFVNEARRLGLEVGILLVIGVPGDTLADARARTEAVAALRPDRLRCVAFEPTVGHPFTADLASRGLIDPNLRLWNRELHRPAVTPAFGLEDFIASWSDGLMLLADVEARRAAK